MANMPGWDFTNCLYAFDAQEHYNFLRENPTTLGQYQITFKFKPGVKYPTLPVPIDGNLIFPMSGTTHCTAQEFFVAFPLLAECNIVGKFYKSTGQGPFAELTQSLIDKRRQAKEQGDEFLDGFLKLIINSGYGKTCQGLRHKRSIDLENSSRNRVVTSEIPPSKITNPALGAFITGFVRAVIGELLNYMDDAGVPVLYTTTDGFATIGKIPEEAFYGVGPLSRWIHQRTNAKILEVKHSGMNFLGIKNRCYSIEMSDAGPQLASIAGVSRAACGNDPNNKAWWLADQVKHTPSFQSRRFDSVRLPTMREWILDDASPANIIEKKGFNFDYDLKRRPLVDTAHDVNNIGCFDTTPWTDIEEFFQCRRAYQNYGRGHRGKSGQQEHLTNKILRTADLKAFLEYLRLTDVFHGQDSTQRLRTNGAKRIVANIAYHKLGDIGTPKLAKSLDLDRETVRYWVSKNPMDDGDIAKDAVEGVLYGLLTDAERVVVSESVDPTD